MSKRIIFWLFYGLTTLLIISSLRSIYTLWRKRDITVEREIVLTQLEAENKKLKFELEESLTDEFVEKEARDKLGLARPGDKIVIIDQPEGATAAASQPQGNRSPPSWQEWWGLFK